MKRAVVLDTNCLVQMLSVHSPYRSAWQAFRDGKYELCVTDDIVDEYEEIIERVANAAVAHNIVNAIIRSPYTRFFTPHFRFRLIEQDPDDNKFVDCAIVAGADYIVSEDAHFRVLEKIPFPKTCRSLNGIKVLPIRFVPPLSPPWRRAGRLFSSLPRIKDIKIKRSLQNNGCASAMPFKQA